MTRWLRGALVLSITLTSCVVKPPYKSITINDFRRDGEQGQVVYDFGDKTYTGRVDAQGLPHGNGRLTYSNGIIIEGAFVAGSLEGERATAILPGLGRFEGVARNGAIIKGRVQYENGDAYDGGLLAFLPQGTGLYTNQDGTVLYGEFQAGQLNGEGYVHDPSNSESLVGRFTNGFADGEMLRIRANDRANLLVYDNGVDVTEQQLNESVERIIQKRRTESEMTYSGTINSLQVRIDALKLVLGKRTIDGLPADEYCRRGPVNDPEVEHSIYTRTSNPLELSKYWQSVREDYESKCGAYSAALTVLEGMPDLHRGDPKMIERELHELEAELTEVQKERSQIGEAEASLIRRKEEERRAAEAKRQIELQRDRCKGAAANSCKCRLFTPCNPNRETPCVCAM